MAVNIYNPEEITKYLEVRAKYAPELREWIHAALYKPLLTCEESAFLLTEIPKDAPEWLQNKWDVCRPFHEFIPDAELGRKVLHILDWLTAAKQNGETYTVNRLQKLATLDNVTAFADRYFEEHNKKQPKIIEDDSDTKTVMSFDDGSRIVQLLTPNALRYEGPSMGHCIGGGSYDEKLLNGSCVFYSLRDKDNNPHATFHVEVEGNILRQCKGKKNEPPVQKYMPYVQQFVTENKFQLKESAAHTGLVQDDAGQYHSIFNLPENLTIRGGLDLDDCIGLTQLPENLSVGGHIALKGCTELTHLPENLSVGSTLFLEHCTGLTHLPENFSVGGSLYLTGCTSLTHLPENLSVGGTLFLEHCAGLKSIPRTIKCSKRIYTDLGVFETVAKAADAFDKKFGRAANARKTSRALKVA